ncbi:hypothetical protein D3C85_1100530 [compost metagenome]
MNKRTDVEIPFRAPIGVLGVLRLQHEFGQGKTAVLSMGGCGMPGAPTASASLTSADMRQLVDGLMDAIHAIERQERL